MMRGPWSIYNRRRHPNDFEHVETFPLLKLPFLAIALIVQLCEELPQMIDLACWNRRFRAILKSCKYTFTSFKLKLKRGEYQFVIKSGTKTLTIQFEWDLRKSRRTEQWKIGGTEILTKMEHADDSIDEELEPDYDNNADMLLKICTGLPYIERLDRISEYLFEFLQFKTFALDIDHSQGISEKITTRFMNKSFTTVGIGMGRDIEANGISTQRLTRYLENIKMQHLALNVEVTDALPGYKYRYSGEDREEATIKVLTIVENDWVDLSNLFRNFNSPRVECFVSSSKKANEVLKGWINNTGDGTVDLVMYHGIKRSSNRCLSRNRFNIDAVFQGIEKTNAVLTQTQCTKLYKCFKTGWEAAWDITRRIDGLRATVWMEPSGYPGNRKIIMVIWTQSQLQRFS